MLLDILSDSGNQKSDMRAWSLILSYGSVSEGLRKPRADLIADASKPCEGLRFRALHVCRVLKTTMQPLLRARKERTGPFRSIADRDDVT
jgi:hypothetical protein